MFHRSRPSATLFTLLTALGAGLPWAVSSAQPGYHPGYGAYPQQRPPMQPYARSPMPQGRVQEHGASASGKPTPAPSGEAIGADFSNGGQAAQPTGGPVITIQERPATVIIEKPQPKITVEQPAPSIDVEQSRPDVSVQQAEPHVQVREASPDVQVREQGEPKVRVSDDTAPTVTYREQNRAQNGPSAFSQFDTDRNGLVSRQEAPPVLHDHWQQLDNNSDGQLDRSEFSALERQSQ